jgi:hypothetical protein
MSVAIRETSPPTPANDAGATAAAAGWSQALLRLHAQPADPAQLAHALGTTTPSPADLVRLLRASGLRARISTTTAEQLPRAVLPAIALTEQGSFAGGGEILRLSRSERSAFADSRFCSCWAPST